MNVPEAAVLLAAIAASDNREVTEAAARSWSVALPDVDLEHALTVLPDYYREATRDTRNWIYPGDVLALVRELHKARRSAAGIEAEAAYLDAHREDDVEHELNAFRARIEALKEYERTHSIPGPSRAERDAEKRDERESMAWVTGMSDRQLAAPPWASA